jgi:hypothetical protein
MLNKLIFGWLIVLAALMSIMTPSVANAAECTLYEQSHPSFLLDGAHLSTGKCGTCASCHRGGVFLGTPKTCIACHNGDPTRITVGRSIDHIPTLTVSCDSCHNTTSFTAMWNMNHTSVDAYRCDSCHNGSYTAYNARAKTSEHVPTTFDCRTCHSTNNWDVGHAQLHAGVTSGCVNCHNGVNATGKINYAPGHPITSNECQTCHSIDAGFKCAEAYDAMINYAQLMLQKVRAFFA